MTYGWVFMILLTTVAVIYSTGIFNFNDFLPESCAFYGQINCVEYRLVSTSGTTADASIVLANNFGTDLIILNATLRDGAGLTCLGMTPINVSWPLDSSMRVNISGCTGSRLAPGARMNADVLLYFYRNSSWCASDPSPCVYISVGSLIAKVS